jgi:hypothetical protein
MSVPFTLADIRNKVRRITGRPNTAQITDTQIDQYVNTYYLFDLNEQLRLESFRYNYQFVTNANTPVYDFPKELYLTNMPPVYIGGYQSYMTQSRENFFRINPQLNLLQQQVATGNGTVGPYAFTLTNTPIVPGFKRNPPGAYTPSVAYVIGTPQTDVPASEINWNVLISGEDANGTSICLVDDGGCDVTGHSNIGLLFDPRDVSTLPANARGTINYITGQVNINAAPGFDVAIAAGQAINCQYIPYVASRPQQVVFYQDQFILYPIPDQAYTVSFEAYKYPTAFLAHAPATAADPNEVPQLRELWQLLAYGASDKIFSDAGDIDSMMKFRPLLEEQLKLCQRRTIVQQTSERTSTIYTEQMGTGQYPFGNLFGGF